MDGYTLRNQAALSSNFFLKLVSHLFVLFHLLVVNHFSPSTMWVSNIKLRPSDLAADALPCWTISPVPLFSFLTCSKLFSVFLCAVYTSKMEGNGSDYYRALVRNKSDHVYQIEYDVWHTVGGRWLMTVVTMNKFAPSLSFFSSQVGIWYISMHSTLSVPRLTSFKP